jgi:lipopolysaccharide export system protein LptC
MAASGDRHSRLVFWLKITLPLVALAMLSTMFLVARTVVTEGTIPFSNVDVQGLANDQRLTLPEYSAVTSDGASLTIRAATARPGGEETAATAETVTAIYSTTRGPTVTLTAPEARMSATTQSLMLGGNVRVVTSTGYDMSASRITAQLGRKAFTAEGPVIARAPFGRIEAGSAAYGSAKVGQPPDVLVFNQGVRLVYNPKP